MKNMDVFIPKLVLNSKACLLLPQNIDEMKSEHINFLYPNQPKPDQVLVYGDEEFWISLTLTNEAVSKEMHRTRLCQYRGLIIKKFRGMEIGEIGYVSSIVSEEKIYYFSIYTKGIMGDTYQQIFLYSIKGKEMKGTVCCYGEEWYLKADLFRKIIGSIVDLTGTWEYTIRSERLYEKAKQYYRDVCLRGC